MRTAFFLSLRAKRSNPNVLFTPRDSSVAPLSQNDREEGSRLPRPDAIGTRNDEKKFRDCFVVLPRRTPRNDSRHSQFDLEWDDKDVVPEVVNPDVNFLLQRMNEVVLEKVAPMQGEMIVDIGCGRGIDGVELAKRGAVVIGLEPSNIMIEHAKNHIAQNGASMAVIQGVGEHLPFQAQSVDKIVCKGALDHFPDPAMVIRQIAMVLKPRGKAIIAIANFESLGFKLGRIVWRFRKKLGFKSPEGRMPWEMPEDHTYKFDYAFLRRLVGDWLEVEQASGISLLFGLPWWGVFLAKCPRGMSLGVLNTLDELARHLPSLSDVVVLRCKPK